MFMSNDLGVLQCTQAIMHYMQPCKQGLLVNIYGQGSFLRPAFANWTLRHNKSMVDFFHAHARN